MRLWIISLGIVLVVAGTILYLSGQDLMSHTSHLYGQSDEEYLVSLVMIVSGAGLFVGGIIICLAGFFKSAKLPKEERLKSKIEVKKLKNELKMLKRE